MAHPDSYLAALASGRHGEPLRDATGAVFIDRDGALFGEVLALLRDGPEWRPPEGRRQRAALARELAYFSLQAPPELAADAEPPAPAGRACIVLAGSAAPASGVSRPLILLYQPNLGAWCAADALSYASHDFVAAVCV